MDNSVPLFPIIEFHDEYGHIHRIREIIESTTFDGDKKVTYFSNEGEEFCFVIKNRNK